MVRPGGETLDLLTGPCRSLMMNLAGPGGGPIRRIGAWGSTRKSGAVMGIYDREYYRGDSTGPGLFGGVAPITKSIIAINVGVFLLAQLFRVNLTPTFGASATDIFERGHVWQLLTATFLHKDFMHILGNMWFLWLVGREMESLYGHRDYLAFYLVSAVVSTFGWAAINTSSEFNRPMIGASGAVMAVVTLYTLFYPRREILFFFLPMPMWVVLLIYLGMPILNFGQDSFIAYEAHLIGAAFAVAYKHFDLRWSRLTSGRFRRPRLKIFSPVPLDQTLSRAPTPGRFSSEGLGVKTSPVSVLPEEQLDARLDEILAKIAREGRSSLNEEEQRILQEASRRARNRRSDRP